MSSYQDRRRRKRRKEEEDKRRKKRAAERRAEEHRQRDLQGESLYEFIKSQFPGLPHMTDAHRMTPETLLRYMGKFNKSIRAEDNYFARWAAANNDLPLLQTLYAHGADLTALNNYIPRHFAKRGNLDALLWLRDEGMNIIPYLNTFMHNLGDENALDRMDELLRAEPSLSVQHNSAIVSAARAGHLHVLEWYRDRGAAFDFNDHECGFKALTGGHVPVLDFLEKQGVDMKRYARDAAAQAASDGKTAALEWLDSRKIPYDLNVCVRLAANSHHTDLVRRLYEKGARLNDRTEAWIIRNGEDEDMHSMRDFILAARNTRNAHYVTEAFNATLDESRAARAAPGLARRLLGKFGL